MTRLMDTPAGSIGPVTAAGVESVPERRAHRVGSPRIGLDKISESQFSIRWPGITLGLVSGPQPVAEEVAVDVGKPCPGLRNDPTELGVQFGQNFDDLGHGGSPTCEASPVPSLGS